MNLLGRQNVLNSLVILIMSFWTVAGVARTPSYLDQAARDIQSLGVETTVENMNSQKGIYSTSHKKFFIFDEQGVVLSSNGSPGIVGKSYVEKPDKYGNLVFGEILERTRDEKEGKSSYCFDVDISLFQASCALKGEVLFRKIGNVILTVIDIPQKPVSQ